MVGSERIETLEQLIGSIEDGARWPEWVVRWMVLRDGASYQTTAATDPVIQLILV